MMLEYGLVLVCALILALAMTPLSCPVAMRLGAIDHPDTRRIHARATPRFGGPAILLAIICAMLLTALLDRSAAATLRAHWCGLRAVGIGAIMVTVIGAIDDIRSMRPAPKLAVEVVAAGIVVCGCYRVGFPPFGMLGALSFALRVLFIVAIINAINLVDGLDGLAAGLSLMIALTLLLFAHSSSSALMLLALCGALLGFLPWNLYPARIFLGDSGALLLGFMLGAVALAPPRQNGGLNAMVAPMLAMGLPLFEMMLTVVRRTLRATPRSRRALIAALFTPDRDHIHHRLLDIGIEHMRAVLMLYGVGTVFCAAALMIPHLEAIQAAPLMAFLVVAVLIGMRRLGYLEPLSRPKHPLPHSEPPMLIEDTAEPSSIVAADAPQLQISASQP